MKTERFAVTDLRLVSPAPPPDNPPLAIGDYCALNSGGPAMLVVDAEGDRLVVAWPFESKVIERNIPRACVRRADQ